MTLDEVAERMGVSKRTVMRWVDQRRFPAPTDREGRVLSWNARDVERWRRQENEREAKREADRHRLIVPKENMR